MRNDSDKSCSGNQKTHFLFSNFFFPENCAVHEIMWKNSVERGRPQMTIWRMCIACWITMATHTLTVCNTYCSSTATMVARTLLNVTLIYTLLVLFLTGVVLHGKTPHSNDHNPFTFGWRRKLHTSRVSLTNLPLNLYILSTVRTCVLAVKLLMNPFLPQSCFGRSLGRTLVHSSTSLKPTLKISHFYSLAPKFTIECCFALGTARVQTLDQKAAILTQASLYFFQSFASKCQGCNSNYITTVSYTSSPIRYQQQTYHLMLYSLSR